jgi:uncharacterized membrane-anchored protein
MPAEFVFWLIAPIAAAAAFTVAMLLIVLALAWFVNTVWTEPELEDLS